MKKDNAYTMLGLSLQQLKMKLKKHLGNKQQYIIQMSIKITQKQKANLRK